jgi:two-component system, LuxR family, sensor histidine kinase DctS
VSLSQRKLALEPFGTSKRAHDESWISKFAPLGAGIALLLIFLLLGALLWLLDRDEQADDRDQLIRDVLWVEQALQFQFDSERTRLLHLAKDIADGRMTTETFTAQARQYTVVSPDLVDLVWLNEDTNIVAAVPSRVAGENSRVEPDPKLIAALSQMGRQGAFSPPFERRNGQPAIAYVAPIIPADHRSGMIVAVFDLATLLNHQVPWWIAEKRAVALKDASGKMLAARSTVVPDEKAPFHTIEMGPPLRQLTLTLTSYRERRGLAQNGLVVAMVVLGLSAAAGIAARERQLRKRRAAETAFDEERAFRKAMESSLLVGIRARDLDGRLLYANQAFCRMVGYSLDELVGTVPPMPYWVPEQYELTRRLHDAVLAGQVIGEGFELKFKRRDGTKFDVLIYEAPLIDAQGVQRGWMGSVLDVSDRKRAEEFARAQAERLQHTARLVTMGEIASLLAHDLNQPLAAISSYQTGLQNRIPMGDLTAGELSAALGGIGSSAERARLIVKRVHDFVKKREPHIEPLDLRTIIGETLALLRPETQKMRVLPELVLAPALPSVRGDRVLIQQLLVNLVRNALDAMANVPDDLRRLELEVQLLPPARIELSVTDAGIGVSPAIAAELFKPFISTKPGGMGMGLSICRSIAELHGGGMSYAPGEGGGSRFSVELPVATVTLFPAAQPHAATTAPDNSQTGISSYN